MCLVVSIRGLVVSVSCVYPGSCLVFSVSCLYFSCLVSGVLSCMCLVVSIRGPVLSVSCCVYPESCLLCVLSCISGVLSCLCLSGVLSFLCLVCVLSCLSRVLSFVCLVLHIRGLVLSVSCVYPGSCLVCVLSCLSGVLSCLSESCCVGVAGWLNWQSAGLNIPWPEVPSYPVRSTITKLWVSPSQKCCADSLSVYPTPLCVYIYSRIRMMTCERKKKIL